MNGERNCEQGVSQRVIVARDESVITPIAAPPGKAPAGSITREITLVGLSERTGISKSTLSRRARVSVMVPAMRSTAFEVRRGMRVGGVDSFFSTLMVLPSFFSICAKRRTASREWPPNSKE